MQINNSVEQNKQTIKQELDYAKFVKIVLSRWYWVAATLLLSLATAYTYLWYTPEKYNSTLFLKFEDKDSEIDKILNNSGGSRKSTIGAESWVIKSKPVMERAVDHFDWEVSYFIDGKVRVSEMYPDKPFEVEILRKDTLSFYQQPVYFKTNDRGILVSYEYLGKTITLNSLYEKPISLPGVSIIIHRNNNLSNDKLFYFVLNDRKNFANRIASGIAISEIEKNSTIAQITKIDDNPIFAKDALNAIVIEYLNQDLLSKSQSSSQVINFIDDQLAYLASNVKNSGNKLKGFKQENKVIELSSDGNEIFEVVKLNEAELRALELQNILLTQLENQITNNSSRIELNFNFAGGVDPFLDKLTTRWNALQDEKIMLEKTYSKNSIQIADINARIQDVKSAALSNIKATRKNLDLKKGYVKKVLEEQYSKLNAFPQQERQLFDLERDYEIANSIYTTLAQKKLESQISKAAVLPGASLVDSARYNPVAISPNKATTWKFAWIVGLASGIGLIFLVRLLNPYIYDKEFVESLTNTPILGLIRHYPGKIEDRGSQLLSIIKPKSLFAESVRSVRTNLSFVAGDKDSKVICITSEISGEGKSFVSLNIAASLSLIDKKVILIAADLRKSKIHHNFDIKNKEGLSTYLAGQSVLPDIIFPSGQSNLDILVAGPVPPNPAELMYKDELKTLINELKKTYDFVVFDTAPIGLVSDALPLIRISDINLFVIRTGKSKTSAASIPDRIASEYALNNTFIIINDFVQDHFYSHYYSTKYSDGYYGYYYSSSTYDGAGYYDDEGVKRKWWKRKLGQIKKKVNLRS